VTGHQLNIIYRIVGLGAKFYARGLDHFLKVWVKINISLGIPEHHAIQLITSGLQMPVPERDGVFGTLR